MVRNRLWSREELIIKLILCLARAPIQNKILTEMTTQDLSIP